jgi:hypothetical protein
MREAAMKAAGAVMVMLVLSGCMTLPDRGEEFRLRVVGLEEAELQRKCAAVGHRVMAPPRTFAEALRHAKPSSKPVTVSGCFERVGEVCVIYTRTKTDQRLNDVRFQQTTGHEVLHCTDGLYHP